MFWIAYLYRLSVRPHNGSPSLRVARLVALLCVMSLIGPGYGAAQESYVLKIEDRGLITLEAANVPLNTLLEALSRRIPLEIRGGVAPDERVTVQFSRLSLKEALGKMIRTYNYVLVMPEGPGKPMLTIINQISRAPLREEPPSTAATPGGTLPAGPQGTPPVPGASPGIQGMPPADLGPDRPTVQERKGVPRTAPPGSPPGTPGPAPDSVPQSVPEPPVRKEVQAPPQEPATAAPPETIMTPFGFRSAAPQETGSSSGPGEAQPPAGTPAPGTMSPRTRVPQRQPAP